MSRDYEEAANVDESVDDETAMSMAVRRFIHQIAGTGEDTDVEVFEATARALDEIDSLQERLDELEDENEQLRTRLDKLGDIGEEKTSKEQKVASIVTYADNQRGADQDAVTVLPKVIKGLVDVSERYSYTLVDDMVEDFDWAHDPADLPRYGSVEQDAPQKGVCIDFEGVHGEAVPLNKFINGSAEKGVAN